LYTVPYFLQGSIYMQGGPVFNGETLMECYNVIIGKLYINILLNALFSRYRVLNFWKFFLTISQIDFIRYYWNLAALFVVIDDTLLFHIHIVYEWYAKKKFEDCWFIAYFNTYIRFVPTSDRTVQGTIPRMCCILIWGLKSYSACAERFYRLLEQTYNVYLARLLLKLFITIKLPLGEQFHCDICVQEMKIHKIDLVCSDPWKSHKHYSPHPYYLVRHIVPVFTKWHISNFLSFLVS
jgi:hypothetical protein